jgi:hypothetical protein
MRLLFLLFFTVLRLLASDDLFKVSGDVRLAYIDYKYDDSFFPDSYAGVASAKLSIETKKYRDIYAKVSFTTVQGIDHDSNKQAMTYIFSETWKGVNDSYTLLQESYIGYESSLLSLKIGRQEMLTPYIDTDDYYISPNSFEAITLQLRPLKEVILHAGYVDKMSGPWDASYDGADFHSMSRQAWIHYSDGTKDTYPVDAVYAIVGDQGISYLGASYEKDAHKLQLWDNYAHEMFNTIMAQYNYKNKYFDAAVQYSTKREVGKLKDASAYRVHYDVYGARVGGNINEKWNLDLAYTGVSDDDSLHFFGSWGGYPEFASGMAVSYFDTYLRDANIYALTSKHDLSTMINGLRIKLKYAYYDLNSDYTINVKKNTPNGDGYMHAYGIQTDYDYNKQLSFKVIIAGRELESGNQSQLFRSILKYKF